MIKGREATIGTVVVINTWQIINFFIIIYRDILKIEWLLIFHSSDPITTNIVKKINIPLENNRQLLVNFCDGINY